jgi:hypothetical protein
MAADDENKVGLQGRAWSARKRSQKLEFIIAGIALLIVVVFAVTHRGHAQNAGAETPTTSTPANR